MGIGAGGECSCPPLFDRTNLRILSQTPQHDEKAWKKHWDDNPLLPDQIYIAARQRAKNEIRIFEERESVLSPAPTPSVGSNDEVPIDRRRAHERTLGYRNNSDLPRPPKVSASPRARRLRATEQDLRAMAHYLFEKRAVWNVEFSSHYDAWKRFGERPEVSVPWSMLVSFADGDRFPLH